jgi:hypothetical protein
LPSLPPRHRPPVAAIRFAMRWRVVSKRRVAAPIGAWRGLAKSRMKAAGSCCGVGCPGRRDRVRGEADALVAMEACCGAVTWVARPRS